METSKAGADRQLVHERLRLHAMTAWSAIEKGEENPLEDLICSDEMIIKYVEPDRLKELMDIRQHLGLAEERAIELVHKIRESLESA
jgi:adenylosuccinate lyase